MPFSFVAYEIVIGGTWGWRWRVLGVLFFFFFSLFLLCFSCSHANGVVLHERICVFFKPLTMDRHIVGLKWTTSPSSYNNWRAASATATRNYMKFFFNEICCVGGSEKPINALKWKRCERAEEMVLKLQLEVSDFAKTQENSTWFQSSMAIFWIFIKFLIKYILVGLKND